MPDRGSRVLLHGPVSLLLVLVLLVVAACETDRDRADALIAEAQVHLEAGRRLEAREALARATELAPGDHDAWSSLAELYLAGGGWHDADAAAARAIAIAGSARDHEIRAHAALAEERFDDAEAAVARALELGGPEAPLRALLEQAREGRRRAEDARATDLRARAIERASIVPAETPAPAAVERAAAAEPPIELAIEATARGALDQAAVERVAALAGPAMRARVVGAAARGIERMGDVTIAASVSASGRAQHVMAMGALDDHTRDCMAGVVSRAAFPEARGTTRVFLAVRRRRD